MGTAEQRLTSPHRTLNLDDTTFLSENERQTSGHGRDTQDHAREIQDHAREIQDHAREIQDHARDTQNHAQGEPALADNEVSRLRGLRRLWRQIRAYTGENRDASPQVRSLRGATEGCWRCHLDRQPCSRCSVVAGEGSPSSTTRTYIAKTPTAPITWLPAMAPRSQETMHRHITLGRRKEIDAFVLTSADHAKPVAQIHSWQSSLPPTHFGDGEKAAFPKLARFLGAGRDTYQISVLPRPLDSTSLHRFAPRRTAMHIAHTVNDTVSLLFGYLYTIMIIKSRRPPEDSWRAGLPLMEQLPSSLEHPATFIAILQFTIWSLLGILHSLRSPRYWPECGLVAGAVSIATGAWYGVATMIDTIIITAYLSLVVAKAVEWASAWRTRPSGVVLPLSMQDA